MSNSLNNIENRFMCFLEKLSSDDWNVMVNDKWKVRDMVAHMIGWEREATIQLAKSWENKESPWFMKTDDYDEFNKQSVEEFKNYSTNKLIENLKKWQSSLNNEINKIGEQGLRNDDLFSWVFDDYQVYDENDISHYLEHFQQIQKALKK